MENQEERRKYKYEMKPALEARLRKLLPDETDFREFEKVIHTGPRSFIRCNTLKISPQELFERLNKKWKVVQPFIDHKEIMLVEENLLPGELGNSIEHLLGYYYIQEISSMLPPLALDPQPGELILDLFASPGSKTTQIAARMNNQGTIIANDLKIDRIRILVSNIEKAEALFLPIKCRRGITKWQDNTYHKDVEKTCRIYPQDNDSEGFFVSKFTL